MILFVSGWLVVGFGFGFFGFLGWLSGVLFVVVDGAVGGFWVLLFLGGFEFGVFDFVCCLGLWMLGLGGGLGWVWG